MELHEEKTPAAFVSALSDYFLSSIGLEKEGPIYETLKRVLTELEISLSEGGLCAQITRENAQLLIKAHLATDFNTTKANEAIPTPLIFADSENLYLNRDFAVERDLACRIYDFVSRNTKDQSETATNCDAVLHLVKGKSFSVIYGGPGTGKTTSLARILDNLLKDNPKLKIYLGAPTGKASARMHEALEGASKNYPYLQAKLKEGGSSNLASRTIHKWLYSPQDSGERPSEENPLDCDIFVLDEASMLDARLAAQLLRVLDCRRTKILFLGDAYQLRSVGPGSLFADLCALGREKGFAIELKKSFRFDPKSAVGKMAYAINKRAREKNSDAPASESEPAICAPNATPYPVSLNLLKDADGKETPVTLLNRLGLTDSNDVCLHYLESDSRYSQELPLAVRDWIDAHINHYADTIKTGDEASFFSEAQRFRVLCATRSGNLSVASVNAYTSNSLKRALTERGFENPARTGEMIIVTKNDDATDLYNGDMGIILPTTEDGITHALFSSAAGTLRHVSLSLLPEYESAFAITIHKSQGSEYEDVALLLPYSGAETLLSNELLYTAITRVKDRKDAENRIVQYGKLSIFTSTSSLERALESFSARKTGLKNRLRDIFTKDEYEADQLRANELKA